jgi:hypothetical protein
MRLKIIYILMLLSTLAIYAADAPLKLTAKAETNILFGEPIEYTKSTVDSLYYKIAPVQVELTLTNTSNKQITLNTYCSQNNLLTATVTGPDISSVKTIQYLLEMAFIEPKPEDFPKLQPGESAKMQVPFPGMLNAVVQQPQKPGLYHVQYTYTALPTDMKLEQECMHGAVVSNEITFHLVEASTVDGLQFGVETQPAVNPVEHKLNTTGYVKNISDKPITVPAWNFLSNGVTITNQDGKTSPLTFAGADATRKIRIEERFVMIKPGGISSFPMNGMYENIPTNTDAPVGTFSLFQPAGMAYSWEITGETLRLTGQISPAKEDLNNAPEGVWSGKITAPLNVTQLNMTAYRRALLEKNIDTFSILFHYDGGYDKPFYSLRLQTAPVSENKLQNDFFAREIQITKDEAKALIIYLAQTGMLRDATTNIINDASTTYIANITANAQNKLIWKNDMGWSLKMLLLFDNMRPILNTKAQGELDMLTGRLSGFRRVWTAEAELNKPVNIITPAGTLSDAYTYLNTKLKLTSPLKVKDEAEGKKTVPELNFGNISALEIKKVLMRMAE